MNYNVTFAGKVPQKVVNVGKEVVEIGRASCRERV